MAQMVHIKKRNSYTSYTDIKIKELKAIKKEARARGSGLSIIPISTNYPSFKDRLVLSIYLLTFCSAHVFNLSQFVFLTLIQIWQ